MKEVYLQGIEELLSYDHADLASSCIRSLLGKGYSLAEEEMELAFKVEVYCLLLYELGRLSLDFSSLRCLSLPEVLHYFFTNQDLEDTPLLVRCFDIFPDGGSRWRQEAFKYLFSPSSHLSTLLRLLQHKQVHFEGTPEEFEVLLGKVTASRCDIGKYAD